MMAFTFTRQRWCALSADDRFHVLADRATTLCGIGWQGGVATRADWTQCALCAHEVAKEDTVLEGDPDGAVA